MVREYLRLERVLRRDELSRRCERAAPAGCRQQLPARSGANGQQTDRLTDRCEPSPRWRRAAPILRLSCESCLRHTLCVRAEQFPFVVCQNERCAIPKLPRLCAMATLIEGSKATCTLFSFGRSCGPLASALSTTRGPNGGGRLQFDPIRFIFYS
jgi:hypothetical protein